MIELRALIGSGDKIALFALPSVLLGVALNVLRPGWFDVGGPPPWLRVVSVCLLMPGLVVWAWSVVLIATKARRGELITTGPFALVRHPLYTGVALLVLPPVGFLLDTWLCAALGLVMYVGTRIYAAEEEHILARTFGPAWHEYRRRVWIPWL